MSSVNREFTKIYFPHPSVLVLNVIVRENFECNTDDQNETNMVLTGLNVGWFHVINHYRIITVTQKLAEIVENSKLRLRQFITNSTAGWMINLLAGHS